MDFPSVILAVRATGAAAHLIPRHLENVHADKNVPFVVVLDRIKIHCRGQQRVQCDLVKVSSLPFHTALMVQGALTIPAEMYLIWLRVCIPQAGAMVLLQYKSGLSQSK